jgi:hypothetical protein
MLVGTAFGSVTSTAASQTLMPAPLVAATAGVDRELKSVQQDLKIVEASYGHDMLNLLIPARFVSQIVGNPRIAHYLSENHPEVLTEFRAIVSAAPPTHDAAHANMV